MKDSTAEEPEKGSRLDPEPMGRRDFLGLAAGWAAFAALGFGALGIARLPKPGVLPSPSKKFRVTLPDTLAPGQPFVPKGRSVAVFVDAAGAYAVSLICTHLGCVVKATDKGFDCPCHGSTFGPDGAVLRGPAPTALPWLAVSHAGGRDVIVDESSPVPAGSKAALS